MSSVWSALHAQLLRSVNRHSNLHKFRALWPSEPDGPRFRTPVHLLDDLHSPGGDVEARNRVLAELLRHAVGDDGGLATELLLLALWPGLCVVRRRLLNHRNDHAIDADLASQMTIGIRQSDPERIHRVAATLLRNVERDLRRTHRTQDARFTDRKDMAEHLALAAVSLDRPERILQTAQETLGADGLLITAVHVGGFTQKEAGARLGLSHDAARKRCQRTLTRLQTLEPN